jgi:hypothetical protein
MTTFHDPQPQSRRAARESQRALHTDPEYLEALDRDAQYAEAQKTGDITPPSGRRARAAEASGAGNDEHDDQAAEPLTYSTQIPSYEGPGFARAQRAARENRDEADSIEQAPQQFRVRDYSPEGRRSATHAPSHQAPSPLDYHTEVRPPAAGSGASGDSAIAAPASAPSAGPASSGSSSTENRPLTRRELRALREQAEAAAGVTPLVEPEQQSAQPTALSNAMAEFEALTRTNPPLPTQHEPAATPSLFPAIPTAPGIPGPAASDRVDDVPPPVGDWTARAPQVSRASEASVAPLADAPTADQTDSALDLPISPELETSQPFAWPFGHLTPSHLTPGTTSSDDAVREIGRRVDTDPRSGVHSDGDTDIEPADSAPDAATNAAPTTAMPIAAPPFAAPVAATPLPVAPEHKASEQPGVAASAEDTLTPDFVEPRVREPYTPPIGHWSRQADLDDESQPFENTLGRQVGGGSTSTATSALILPSVPQGDFVNLIHSTGEIMVTGRIELPPSLATTGGDSRRYDDPNVDHMFDAADAEVVANDSAPVRAIRAVSTHTSSTGVIQAQKPQSNRLLTIGIITACVLAVAVVGLLAVYIVSGL